MKAFFNARLGRGGAGGARRRRSSPALVYPLLRREPKGRVGRRTCRAGSRSGPPTVLVVQATLALQVAWYLWRWGAAVTWIAART